MSTPALLAVAAASLALALPVIVGAASLDAAIRASGAADAAALAAADAAHGWIEAEPCALAATVANSAGVSLETCEVELAEGDVRVVVGAQTALGRITAAARASARLSSMDPG